MDYKKYRILYSPRVIDSLDKIYQYIAEEIGSVESARRKVASIRKDINRLEIFPQAGFDADEKFGKKLDPRYQTRGLALSKDYIVLYTIVEDTVRLAYLLPSKSEKGQNEHGQAKLTQKDMPYIFTICQKQFESVALLLVLDNPRYKESNHNRENQAIYFFYHIEN